MLFRFRYQGWQPYCNVRCADNISKYILVHSTKMSVFHALLQLVEGLECREHIAVTSACDDLSGKCLSPIAHLASRAASVLCVSDLDGRGLASSVVFESAIRHACSPSIPVASLGINDGWLGLLRRTSGPRFGRLRRSITIAMNSHDRLDCSRALKYSCDWKVRVGSRSLTLLRRGHKVCLEGVLHREEWRNAFGRSLNDICKFVIARPSASPLPRLPPARRRR